MITMIRFWTKTASPSCAAVCPSTSSATSTSRAACWMRWRNLATRTSALYSERGARMAAGLYDRGRLHRAPRAHGGRRAFAGGKGRHRRGGNAHRQLPRPRHGNDRGRGSGRDNALPSLTAIFDAASVRELAGDEMAQLLLVPNDGEPETQVSSVQHIEETDTENARYEAPLMESGLFVMTLQ